MKNKIFLVTGGTGGHLFPAISLAQELKKQNINFELIVDERCRKYVKNYNLKFNIFISSPLFFNLIKLPKFLIKNTIGVLQSLILFLKEYKQIKIIIGFGGYTCFPALFAGYLLRIPVIVHEQNAVMGKANRILSKFSLLSLISFKKTEKAPQNSKFIGMPVRREFFIKKKIKRNDFENRLKILILGGSQGASIFSEIIPQTLSSLTKSEISKIKIIQQARKSEIKKLSEIYKKKKLSYKVEDFIEDVAKEMQKSDIIITRCGASTLAEVNASSKFSILFPLPSSKDNHQLRNAKEFSKSNKCLIFNEKKLTASELAGIFKKIIKTPNKYKMKFKKNPNSNVTKEIVKIINNL